MLRDCVVLFLSIHLFEQIQILDAFILSCNASLQTVKRVTMCPSNISAYEEAVQKKNCSSLAPDAQTCQSFQYHCVLSDDLNYATEVCAPSMYIVGYVCTKFSTIHKSIMRIDGFACNDSLTECPFGYNSTESFKYLPCYANVSKLLSTEIPPRREISKPLVLWHMLIVLAISVILGTVTCYCLYTFVYKRRTFRRRRQTQPNLLQADIELQNRDHDNGEARGLLEDLHNQPNEVLARNTNGQGENLDDIDGYHDNGEARGLLENLHNQPNEVPVQNRNGHGQVILGENQDDIDGGSSQTNGIPLSSNSLQSEAHLPIATNTEGHSVPDSSFSSGQSQMQPHENTSLIYERTSEQLHLKEQKNTNNESNEESEDERKCNIFRSDEKSKYPAYMQYRTRAKSFNDCKVDWLKEKKEEFARYGFLYQGVDRKTNCFHCGYSKDNWIEKDDIFATHFLSKKSCAYVQYLNTSIEKYVFHEESQS